MRARQISVERARGIVAALRARGHVGQPEGYGIVCGFDGDHWGSFWRMPGGDCYALDWTKRKGRALVCVFAAYPKEVPS